MSGSTPCSRLEGELASSSFVKYHRDFGFLTLSSCLGIAILVLHLITRTGVRLNSAHAYKANESTTKWRRLFACNIGLLPPWLKSHLPLHTGSHVLSSCPRLVHRLLLTVSSLKRPSSTRSVEKMASSKFLDCYSGYIYEWEMVCLGHLELSTSVREWYNHPWPHCKQ